MSNVQKPPTQSVGVAGFKADLYASDIKKIDWHLLIHLPKFQIYAVQMTGGSYGNCSMSWNGLWVMYKTAFALMENKTFMMNM